MNDLDSMRRRILAFRDARNWKQFHNPKDTAMSLVLEAAELLEHFQWKSSEEIDNHVKEKHSDVGDELADVLYWVLLISYDLNIDLEKAFEEKMKKNEKKYPVHKSKDKHTKYTDLK